MLISPPVVAGGAGGRVGGGSADAAVAGAADLAAAELVAGGAVGHPCAVTGAGGVAGIAGGAGQAVVASGADSRGVDAGTGGLVELCRLGTGDLYGDRLGIEIQIQPTAGLGRLPQDRVRCCHLGGRHSGTEAAAAAARGTGTVGRPGLAATRTY